jgi:CheY-like chemotaxis protein
VRQIITNLIGNAIKFTTAGEVAVVVDVTPIDAGHARIDCRVRDTGIGIRESEISRIFQEFTQADGSTTRRFGGTGLGLSISRSLARRMGGEIHVESREGHGSTFTLSAPFEIVTPAAAPPSLPPIRILFADDHPGTGECFLHEVGPLGIRAQAVGSAGEALDALRKAAAEGEPFDATFLDLQLPDMDALTLAHEIHLSQGLERARLVLAAPLETMKLAQLHMVAVVVILYLILTLVTVAVVVEHTMAPSRQAPLVPVVAVVVKVDLE